MRDDTANWPSAYAEGDTLESALLRVVRTSSLRQTMISSSDLNAVNDLSAYPRIGWPEIAPQTDFALTLRRDRVLLVSETHWETGWHAEKNCAVTDASSGLAVFDLSGKGSAGLLLELGEISVCEPSRSVVRRVQGIECIVYRFVQENRFRLHVPQAQAPAFWRGIATRLGSRLTGPG